MDFFAKDPHTSSGAGKNKYVTSSWLDIEKK